MSLRTRPTPPAARPATPEPRLPHNNITPEPAHRAALPLGPDPQRLPWTDTPLDIVRRWPRQRPLGVLLSGRSDPQWARFSVLAEPQADPARHLWSLNPQHAGDADPFRPAADRLQAAIDSGVPHLVMLGYDLGRALDFDAPPDQRTDRDRQALADRAWPDLALLPCPGLLVHDALTQTWSARGTYAEQPPQLEPEPCHDPFTAAPPAAHRTPAEHRAAVAAALDYIAAGDIFQVNLAQRFTADCHGSPRDLFTRLAQTHPAWYAAHLELPRSGSEPQRTLVSASPELFLELDADGHVTTRPIKGTRPANTPADQLRDSLKDQAELNMIVDLLRNDLGRVARFGSVRVSQPRTIESHPTVHHAVATVNAQLRAGLGLVDLLRATFPGGSITGAPKIRAMQIIDELEPVQRGPYCGTVGLIDGPNAWLNITIRTALIEQDPTTPTAPTTPNGRGRLDFSVGGGIVADSDPAAEQQECLDKAAALLDVLRSGV
ncbi:MAG: anthranilate synthase component I family protein [Planctomycetota bacterium]